MVRRRVLRGLRHPLVLASIGLLLVNDHVLKDTLANWWTGKLSDFAGLVFFPFLVALVIGALDTALRRLRGGTAGGHAAVDRVAVLSFGVAGIGFGLVNLWPAFSHAADGLVTLATGMPSRLTPDPTDLMALAALLPAWWIWRGTDDAAVEWTAWRVHRPIVAPQWLGHVALVAAALATMATSGVLEPRVTQVAEDDGVLFAVVNHAFTVPTDDDGRAYVRSGDGGVTWQLVDPDTADGRAAAERLPASDDGQPWLAAESRSACVSGDPSRCYRLDGRRVVVSEDGGQQWSEAWAIPAGRRSFAAMSADRSLLGLGYGSYDDGLYDLVVVADGSASTDAASEAVSHRVIVARGTEGVLVSDEAGDWTLQPVLDLAVPQPFRTLNPLRAANLMALEAMVVGFIAIVVSGLVWMGATACVARSLRGTEAAPAGRMAVILLSAAVILVLFGLVMPLLALSLDEPQIGLVLALGALVGPIAGLICVSTAWHKVAAELSDSSGLSAIARDLRRLVLWLFLVGWLPFVFWAMGFVSEYRVAVALAILAGLAVLVVSVVRLHRSCVAHRAALAELLPAAE